MKRLYAFDFECYSNFKRMDTEQKIDTIGYMFVAVGTAFMACTFVSILFGVWNIMSINY